MHYTKRAWKTIQSKRDKQSMEKKYIENDIDDHRDGELTTKIVSFKISLLLNISFFNTGA